MDGAGGAGGGGPAASGVLSRTGLILACSDPGAGLGWPSRAKDVTKADPLAPVKGGGLEGRAYALGTWEEGAMVSFPALSPPDGRCELGQVSHLSEFREVGQPAHFSGGVGRRTWSSRAMAGCPMGAQSEVTFPRSCKYGRSDPELDTKSV